MQNYFRYLENVDYYYTHIKAKLYINFHKYLINN